MLSKQVYCNNKEKINEVIKKKNRLRIADYMAWSFAFIDTVLDLVFSKQFITLYLALLF